MPKGFFMQGVAILFSRAVPLDDLEPFLIGFSTRRTGSEQKSSFGGPAIAVEFRSDVNGYVLVDIEDRTWPDGMGDLKTEPELFAAWSMGQFGPYAYPGGLKRAADHWWARPEKRGIVPEHHAFVRLRITYLLGAGPKDKVAPVDYDAREELEFVNRLVIALMEHPNAISYFNPNGEVLREREEFVSSVTRHKQESLPPLDLWSNVRLFKSDEEWMMMDTVGMAQLDLPDLEACYPKGMFEEGEVDYFFRNCSLYLLQNGEVIKDTHTMDGPGEIPWRARVVKDGIASPPRRVLRWFPTSVDSIPKKLLPAEAVEKTGSGLFEGIKKFFGR
jgi:hypothetical protein